MHAPFGKIGSDGNGTKSVKELKIYNIIYIPTQYIKGEKVMTDNERDQEIVRLFKEGKNRKEIAEETGREYSSLCRRMRKLGLGVSANTEQKRRCTGCRKLIPDNSYKFCPYCGADIQTEEDKAIKSLTELYQYGSFIPSDAREKFRESIQFACKVLQKGKK